MVPILAATGVSVVFGGFFLVIFILAILTSIFWIWMLIDALVNEPTPMDKLLWFCVIFFLHILGALIYLLVRRGNRTPMAT
ncbi:MAG TPA: PLDc N-terminal domain-containing protein [Phycisphaerae bacterium]|nr:PLDc N-terminal domain-containing protein [Phycisphaerae bacterium]